MIKKTQPIDEDDNFGPIEMNNNVPYSDIIKAEKGLKLSDSGYIVGMKSIKQINELKDKYHLMLFMNNCYEEKATKAVKNNTYFLRY